MREAGLTGSYARAASHERLRRDRVVRRAKWPAQAEWRAPIPCPGHRVDAAHLGRFPLIEERLQAGGGAGQERLPHPRRPGEGEVVASGDGHLEGTPRDHLPDDRAQVGRVVRQVARLSSWGGGNVEPSTPAR